MKAHAQRTARLQLIASMLAGQSWQQAMAKANLSIGRSTAYCNSTRRDGASSRYYAVTGTKMRGHLLMSESGSPGAWIGLAKWSVKWQQHGFNCHARCSPTNR
jgi:hypothetical protein